MSHYEPECCGCNHGELPCNCDCHLGDDEKYDTQKDVEQDPCGAHITIQTQDAKIKALVEALGEAIATIEDYVDYEHDGGWRTEDARAMGEMDIDDYAKDGRLTNARTAIAAAKETA